MHALSAFATLNNICVRNFSQLFWGMQCHQSIQIRFIQLLCVQVILAVICEFNEAVYA